MSYFLREEGREKSSKNRKTGECPLERTERRFLVRTVEATLKNLKSEETEILDGVQTVPRVVPASNAPKNRPV